MKSVKLGILSTARQSFLVLFGFLLAAMSLSKNESLWFTSRSRENNQFPPVAYQLRRKKELVMTDLRHVLIKIKLRNAKMSIVTYMQQTTKKHSLITTN